MQKEFLVYKLNFKSPIHISIGKDEYDNSSQYLHSDSIKSAIFVSALQIYGNDKINNDFFNSFICSSAFPFYREHYFFPKPFLRFDKIFQYKNSNEVNIKKNKKLLWIEKKYFEEIICGNTIEINNDMFSLDGKFLSDNLDSTFQIYKTHINQKVSISKDYAEDSQPFFINELYFSDNAGLFFMVDILKDHKSDIINILNSALLNLSDSGIGRYRNTGFGDFTFTSSTISILTPESSDRLIALSLFCPLKTEIDNILLKESFYSLELRGGYISNPQNIDFINYRKKNIYMFSIGSNFKTTFNLSGKVVDLTPDLEETQLQKLNHKILRDGRTIFLPCKVSYNET